MLGKWNRIVLKCTGPATITGDGSDNAVAGPHATLDCKAKLVGARICARAMASSKTALISVYTGSTKVVDQATLTSTSLTADGTLTAAVKDRIWPAGTEFSLKEECTASSNVNDLAVDLYFRTYAA